MAQTDTNLQRQLQHSRDQLAAWIKVLDGRGVSPKGRSRDPKWRKLNANCRTVQSRIGAVAKIADREQEAARRKAEKIAEAEASAVESAETKGKGKSASKKKGKGKGDKTKDKTAKKKAGTEAKTKKKGTKKK